MNGSKKKEGGVLGTVILAVVAVAGAAYALDLHTHVCERCGQKWRHLGAFNFGEAGPHTCQCGALQWTQAAPWWEKFRAEHLDPELPKTEAPVVIGVLVPPMLPAPAPTKDR